DATGGLDRRRTGGRVRIASQMVHPVYPRQDGQDCDRRRDRQQAEAAQSAARSGGFSGHQRQILGGRIMSNKMWGGRFGSGPDPLMEEINASIDFDRHLY